MDNNRNERKIVGQSSKVDKVLSFISTIGIIGMSLGFILRFLLGFEWCTILLLMSAAVTFVILGFMISTQQNVIELEKRDKIVCGCCFAVGALCLIGGVIAIIVSVI